MTTARQRTSKRLSS